MWKHFLSSIGLLSIALAAALYSSTAAFQGLVGIAALSAFAALGIAVFVAIRFVPRLASHVDWQWLRFFSDFHVTREGWMYFTAVAIVASAAINTANNLLYMVLATLLALLVLSGVFSAVNFSSLRIVVQVPRNCYAGETFPIAVDIHNEKILFPAFSIFLEPPDESGFKFSRIYVPFIPGLRRTSRTGQAMLPRRGRYTLGYMRAASRHPFGFFLKRRNYPVQAECICFPEILPEDEVHIAGIGFHGSVERLERGLGDDLYTIRDYVPSDSARHVHWKASAKTASLKTREYAAEESRRITIAFDRFGRPGDENRFERLVSRAASTAFHLIGGGAEVTLVSDEWEGAALDQILEYLALAEMSGSVAPPAADDARITVSLRA